MTATPSLPNPDKTKFLGIELFRGLATYGVVFIHGLGEIPRDELSQSITDIFSAFSVPFFLLASFYFAIQDIDSGKKKGFIKNRFLRIIIPYLIWSLIYVFARYFKFLISRSNLDLEQVWHDPIHLILFGGAGVQLYFLPLLFTGTVVIALIGRYFTKGNQINLSIILFGFSYCLSSWLSISGNSFDIERGIAFQVLTQALPAIFSNNFLVRICWVFLAWTIVCLPYIFTAIMLNQLPLKSLMRSQTSQYLLIGLTTIFTLSALAIFSLNQKIAALSIAFPLVGLLIGILGSKYLIKNTVVETLGKHSYGIYLSHALFTAGFLPLMIKFYPSLSSEKLSFINSIIASSTIFLMSWLLTYIILLNKYTARFLLGSYRSSK
jgi:peptidoglycan/LPS O-acetylase OafA/YrhL